MALRTFVKCCPLLVTGLDHPSLALEGWSVGIVVLAWTLDPDVLLPEGPKHQDAIRLLVLPMGRWVWGSARKRHLSGSSVECERGARRRVSCLCI